MQHVSECNWAAADRVVPCLAATMSAPSALVKQPPIQSTAGAVPVRNEKGEWGAPGEAGGPGTAAL